ncbi:MAG: nickel pincer cofactor biosynthesis protein LarC [Myxococcota bacterium]|nr:nickel pincer cofactor biosynthesis protein LarC [Myxococcota bacterium]
MVERLLYFDCFSGIAGDMTLGALIDLGVDADSMIADLKTMPLDGWTLTHRIERRMGLRGVDVHVRVGEQIEGPAEVIDGVVPISPVTETPKHSHRHYGEIVEIIEGGSLPDAVRHKALAAFEVLADAEAKVHGISRDQVHFHEVGAVDSIIDIVGCAWGIWALGIDRIESAPLPLGRGFTRCAHGRMPQPAPATLEILSGLPMVPAGLDRELVTPTGAAFVKAWASRVGALPEMTIDSVGWGVGDAQFEDRPNMLRLIVGHRVPDASACLVIEANLDDLNPEVAGFVLNRLFEAGALDAWFVPIQMKKNRPGIIVAALANTKNRVQVENVLLSESSAIGLRRYPAERTTLERRFVTVQTPWGQVRLKTAWRSGVLANVAPEFEDCARVARASGVPLKVVYQHAVSEFMNRPEPETDTD